MNIENLHSELEALKVPEDKYYLHGLFGSSNDEGKLSLAIRKGKYTIEYEVYIRERGEKQTIMNFTSEEDACNYFLKRIKESKEIEDKYFKP